MREFIAIFIRSLFPYWTFHNLSVSENCIVFCEVQTCCTEDEEMKYLVAGAAHIILTRGTAFWTSYHVNDGALDVYVASESVDPTLKGCDVFFHEFKHDEH